jgi:hypothetical protein
MVAELQVEDGFFEFARKEAWFPKNEEQERPGKQKAT